MKPGDCREGVQITYEPGNGAWIREWGELLGNGPVINSFMICAPATSLAVLARIIKQAPLGTRIDQSGGCAERVVLRK